MRSWVAWVKAISFVLCAFISACLSLNMFIQLSVVLFWDKILLGLTSLAFEGGKIFNLIQAGGFWDQSKNKQYKKMQRIAFKAKAIRKFIIYAMLAALAILSSFGFTLVTVSHRDRFISTTNTYQKIAELNTTVFDNKTEIERLKKQIDNLDSQLLKLGAPTYIESLTDSSITDEKNNTNKSTFKSKKIDPNYLKAQQDTNDSKNKINDQITAYKTSNENIKKQIEILKEEEKKQDKTNDSADMFTLIGDTWHVSRDLIIFWILLVISILLEILLFTLSFDNDLLHKTQKADSNNKNNKLKDKNKDKDENQSILVSSDSHSTDSQDKVKVEIEKPVLLSSNTSSLQVPVPTPIIVDMPILKEEFENFKIEEKLLKYIYDKIYYYVQEKLRLEGLGEAEYFMMDFCVNDIVFNVADNLRDKYIDYLSYSGMIIHSTDQHEATNINKVFYKLKVFKTYDDLIKKRLR